MLGGRDSALALFVPGSVESRTPSKVNLYKARPQLQESSLLERETPWATRVRRPFSQGHSHSDVGGLAGLGLRGEKLLFRATQPPGIF